MVTTTLTISDKDIAELERTIDRAVTELGKTPKEAANWAMQLFLKSVRASTKGKVGKRRAIRTRKDGSYSVSGYFRYNPARSMQKAGKGRRRKQTPSAPPPPPPDPNVKVKDTLVFRRNTPTAVLNRVATIRNAGLAKKAWGWLARDLYNENAGPGAFNRPRDVLKASTADTRNGFSVRVENALYYAEDAFRTKGARTVDNSMERAMRGMEHQIDRRVERMLARQG